MQCPNCTCNQMTRLYKYFRCCFFLQFPKNVPPQPTSDEDDSDVKEEYSSDSSLTDDNREGRARATRVVLSRSPDPQPSILPLPLAVKYVWQRILHTMGARRIFSRGGQWGGLKDGSPPTGSRGSSPEGGLGQSPQKLTTFSQNDA